MKVGLLVPVNGIKRYGDIYLTIISFLEKKGHQVIHPLSINEEMLLCWSTEKREAFFKDYYARVNKSDLIIAECSYPCINMGYEIAGAIQQGKEIIVLKSKDAESSLKHFDPLYTKKNIYIYEYQLHNLKETLGDAIAYNPAQKYKKYNILFTPEMVAKLNEISRKKNLPKSVYIRQLLEKGLEDEN